MKSKDLRFFVIALLVLFAAGAAAVDNVDIGLPSSETGHAMVSWGPIEPANSGGSYGGIDHCRAIWSNFDTPTPGSPSASIDLAFAGGPELVSFKHLDGPADDSFEAWMGGVKMFTYNDSGLPGEMWYVSGFNASMTAGTHTVTFIATGPQWAGWSTYGQVCFAGIWVGPGGPVPTEDSTWSEVKALFR